MGMARSSSCTRLWGECAVATVRTGLVILIGAGSSEVGAGSPGAEAGIAFVCMS